MGSNHTRLAVISLNFALEKEIICNWFWKSANTLKKKMIRCIIDDLESSSDVSHDSDEK